MHTIHVNTATRESDEQFKTDKYLRCAVTDNKACLDFIQALFFTPSADNMADNWLRQGRCE
ncbi:Putative antirestriction protein [Klebsiella michiganensis]|nr:Putative antirestriction protein [Klebsiella michiganensis]